LREQCTPDINHLAVSGSATSRNPVLPHANPAEFRGYRHGVVTPTATLNIVDLTNAGQRKLGFNHNALLARPRSTNPATRAWPCKKNVKKSKAGPRRYIPKVFAASKHAFNLGPLKED
jgi:hypothetical protein